MSVLYRGSAVPKGQWRNQSGVCYVVLLSDCRRLNKYMDTSMEHSRAVSIQSPDFRPEGRCLIPEQATWDKVALGQVCLQALRCASLITIPKVTHINLSVVRRLHNASIRAPQLREWRVLKMTVNFVMSVCLSVRSHGNCLDTTGQICMKFGIWIFFENVARNFKINYG